MKSVITKEKLRSFVDRHYGVFFEILKGLIRVDVREEEGIPSAIFSIRADYPSDKKSKAVINLIQAYYRYSAHQEEQFVLIALNYKTPQRPFLRAN